MLSSDSCEAEVSFPNALDELVEPAFSMSYSTGMDEEVHVERSVKPSNPYE